MKLIGFGLKIISILYLIQKTYNNMTSNNINMIDIFNEFDDKVVKRIEITREFEKLIESE